MEIREIKEKLSIGEVLAHYGYEPTKTGLLKCPWHEETDPKKKRKKTLQVYYDSNRFQCFKEGCVGNGDVIDFIQHEEKCDKHKAILKAKEILGVPMSPLAPMPSNESGVVEQSIKEARSDEENLLVSPSSESSSKDANKPDQSGSIKSTENHYPFFKVVSERETIYQTSLLDIKLLGGIRLDIVDTLKVTLNIGLKDSTRKRIRTNLNLYQDDLVQKLARKVAERLEIGTIPVVEALEDLTIHLEEYRLAEERKEEEKDKLPELSPEERAEALQLLRSPDLLLHTNVKLGESGIVGEELNRVLLFLVYSSRKRPNPLHVICLGGSGTGKTYLQEKE